MEKYHPVRYGLLQKLQAKREDAKAAELQKRMLGLLKANEMDSISLARDREMRAKQLSDEGYDEDAAAPWREAALVAIRHGARSFGEFGRNIFDMTLVSAMLKRVDVDDVAIEDTQLPYPSIYMHFGHESGLLAHEGTWIDGAYLSGGMDGNEMVSVTFVANHPEWEKADRTPLGTTYKRTTSAVTAQLSCQLPVSRSLAEMGLVGDPCLISCGEAIKAALRLAVNGILYLSMPAPDIEFGYPEEAPAPLVAAAASRKASESKKATQKLLDGGYVKINFLGRRMTRETAKAVNDHTTARATHWRSGHWRRVVVGKGRLGREWRLFPPTVVNSGAGSPKRGRLHIVKPRNEQDGARQA